MKMLILLVSLGLIGGAGTAIAQVAGSKAAPAPAAAPAVDTSAEITTATYGDWQLRCHKAPPTATGTPAKPICEVVQIVVIKGQSAPFAQLAFGKSAPTEPLVFTAVVPTNIALPSTLKVAVDDNDKQAAEAAWTRCVPGGCFASVAPKDDLLKHWRSQNDGGVFMFKNSAGQDLKVPFSFRGLARALDAFAKEG